MKKIQQILCPIDFSDFSRHAFDRAVAIAFADGAALTALHVVPVQTAAAILPYMGPETLGPIDLPQVDPAQLKREMLKFLAIDASLPVPVTCEVTEAPDVHREILMAAKRLHADLIVLGTHGRSGFHRIFLGSIAEKVLRQSPVAVMTVPPSHVDVVPIGIANHQPFRRVLCAVDFSECSLLGLRDAIALAQQHSATLGVLHVVELAPPAYDPLGGPAINMAEYKSAAELVARDRLAKAIPASARSTLPIEEMIVVGRPRNEIVKTANEWRSDLIVMGIHGRNVVDRMLFGSTVEPVIRQAPCPVLTVRSSEKTASAAA